jgi:hypothetical protein
LATGLFEKKKKKSSKLYFEECAKQLQDDGYVVFDAHRLIPFPYFAAIRRYYRQLSPWLYQRVPGTKFRTYNDEPVARQLNLTLTEFAEKIWKTDLVSASLALSIFIKKGPGFQYHTDTSPPFDLTLDLVVDHYGASRPIYFVFPNEKVQKVELGFGESILFRGAEITHFGGDLLGDSYHNVMLLTWQKVEGIMGGK